LSLSSYNNLNYIANPGDKWGSRSGAKKTTIWEYPNCAFFIPSADFAGALRLQNQRFLPICASGAGIARATRTNGMLRMSLSK
jgi:hypothetical protein